ncbi:putative phage abortive infection protein [Janthinobacterium sp. LB3P112]|uniref:putative phage abortive infection protein n=1 Tax=Janthinobacterium sp. LB3P112 TaxID=3424196 RepID=UPI003F27D7CC
MMKIFYQLFTDGDKEELDVGTKKLINALAAVVLIVASIVVVLLVIDYRGHATGAVQPNAEAGAGNAGQNGATQFNYGTFGDFFGGVLNPILTFGTFIGLAITIIYQRISMRATRLQAFETTLFNMLELHNQIVAQLRFNPISLETVAPAVPGKLTFKIQPAGWTPPEMAEGRAVFNQILEALKVQAKKRESSIVETYKDVLQDQHNYVLGHYFRNLYQILRLIKRNQGPVLSKFRAQEYSAIVRSQLSAYELALLFLNCQRNVADHNGKFKSLLVEFELLEHLPLKRGTTHQSLEALDFSAEIESFKYYFDFDRQNNLKFTPGAYGTNPEVSAYIKSMSSQSKFHKNEK